VRACYRLLGYCAHLHRIVMVAAVPIACNTPREYMTCARSAPMATRPGAFPMPGRWRRVDQVNLPAPLAPRHMVEVDDGQGGTMEVLGCNAAAGCQVRAAIQWAHEVETDEEEAAALAEVVGVELHVGEQVPAYGCVDHAPEELLPSAEAAAEGMAGS
jgi:hypothetical protein